MVPGRPSFARIQELLVYRYKIVYLRVSKVGELEQVGEVGVERVGDLLPRRGAVRQRVQAAQGCALSAQCLY